MVIIVPHANSTVLICGLVNLQMTKGQLIMDTRRRYKKWKFLKGHLVKI
jgi:hypothetical protein